MISPEASTLITLIFYALASIVGLAGMIMRSPLWRRLGCWLAMAGFICQTLMLAMGFHKAARRSEPGRVSADAGLVCAALRSGRLVQAAPGNSPAVCRAPWA